MGKRYKIEKPKEEVTKAEEEALQTAIKAVEEKEGVKISYAVVDATAVNVRQKPSIESLSVDILAFSSISFILTSIINLPLFPSRMRSAAAILPNSSGR